MYFSKYHSGLCFIDRGRGNLEINGKGSISASDTETWNQDESWKEQCAVLTVNDGITAICVGVLEQFPNMVKLRLPKSVTRIDMTDELNTLFHKNDVLVHAAYGSYGDTVAQNNGLRFLPENIELAGVGTRSMTRAPSWYCASTRTARWIFCTTFSPPASRQDRTAAHRWIGLCRKSITRDAHLKSLQICFRHGITSKSLTIPS